MLLTYILHENFKSEKNVYKFDLIKLVKTFGSNVIDCL